MDLNLLRSLVAVAEAGAITEAATRLGLVRLLLLELSRVWLGQELQLATRAATFCKQTRRSILATLEGR